MHSSQDGPSELGQSICPGCGLAMPADEQASYDGYYQTSSECWGVYTEVLGAEFSNAVLFGQVHQLTVDSYAVQHAGGPHPDKSVVVHLSGLYLVLEMKLAPPTVALHLQRLASRVNAWPHFPPPSNRITRTVLDVAMAESMRAHVQASRVWASAVWTVWKEHHRAVGDLVEQHLQLAPNGR